MKVNMQLGTKITLKPDITLPTVLVRAPYAEMLLVLIVAKISRRILLKVLLC